LRWLSYIVLSCELAIATSNTLTGKGIDTAPMIVEKATPQKINLYYDLYVPERAESAPRPLLIGLHGYEGNKESMLAKLQAINNQDFIIASLQGPDAFFVRDGKDAEKPRIGFGWMMQYKAKDTVRLHHQTLDGMISEIDREFGVDRSAIFLIGFSQSVSLNYRYAFSHPGAIRGIVAVCGGIPGDWDADDHKYSESDTDVLILAGESDEFYPVQKTRGFKNALLRRARFVEFRSFAGGHVFPNEMLSGVNEWLVARLPAR
jgi:phospholipase/carboxylesterase